jgi:hypothetical protein
MEVPAARLVRERSLCQVLPQQTIGNQRLALRYQTVECNEIGAAAQLRRPSKSVWQRFDIRATVPDNYQALRNELEAFSPEEALNEQGARVEKFPV